MTQPTNNPASSPRTIGRPAPNLAGERLAVVAYVLNGPGSDPSYADPPRDELTLEDLDSRYVDVADTVAVFNRRNRFAGPHVEVDGRMTLACRDAHLLVYDAARPQRDPGPDELQPRPHRLPGPLVRRLIGRHPHRTVGVSSCSGPAPMWMGSNVPPVTPRRTCGSSQVPVPRPDREGRRPSTQSDRGLVRGRGWSSTARSP